MRCSAWAFMEQRKYTQNREIKNCPVEQGIEGKDAERITPFPKTTPYGDVACQYGKVHTT